MKHYNPFLNLKQHIPLMFHYNLPTESFRFWKLFVALIIVVSLTGCMSWFMPEAKMEDRLEVGLYNSLMTAETTYKELTAYAQDNHHLFSAEQKATINTVSDTYTQTLLMALSAWHSFKSFGDQAYLEAFIKNSTLAMREMHTLHNLIKMEDPEMEKGDMNTGGDK